VRRVKARVLFEGGERYQNRKQVEERGGSGLGAARPASVGGREGGRGSKDLLQGRLSLGGLLSDPVQEDFENSKKGIVGEKKVKSFQGPTTTVSRNGGGGGLVLLSQGVKVKLQKCVGQEFRRSLSV